MHGVLYLIPNLLGNHAPEWSHAPETIKTIHSIRYFAVEKLHPAVHFLKRIGHPEPDFKLEFYPLDKRVTAEQLTDIVHILQRGEQVGVISEAGCPGIADPGADLVWMCHLRGIPVKVLVGPSAILMSVMAAGLNGQSFAFNGYLPVKADDRDQRIRELQNRSARDQQTQVFIEAPHRNEELLMSLRHHLNADTKLAVCWNLMADDEWVKSTSVDRWNTVKTPDDFIRKPAMFLFQASNTGSDAIRESGRVATEMKKHVSGGHKKKRRTVKTARQ